MSAGPAPAPDVGRADYRDLLRYTAEHRRPLLLGGFLSILGGATSLLQPLAARGIVDHLDNDETGSLTGPLVVLTLLVVLGAIFGGFGHYVMERTAESVVLAVRRSLSDRMLRLPVATVERLSTGDLMSRMTADTLLLREVTTKSVVEGSTAVFTLIGTIVLMALTDLVLFAVVIGVVSLLVIVAFVVLPPIGRASGAAQAAIGAMGGALERSLSGFRTVKASGTERLEIASVRRSAEAARDRGIDVARWTAVGGVSTGVLTQVAFLAVLGVGGARTASGDLSVGALISFLLYTLFLTSPVITLMAVSGQLQTGLAAMTRIREIQALPVEPEQLPVPPSDGAAPRPAHLTLAGVRFTYPDDEQPVLKGVTFDVPARGMTALVGPSGAGKSTIFGLLERFYEVSGGAIFLDGRPLSGWTLSELRSSIGYVEQDAPVLAGTVRENLYLGNAEEDPATLAAVLRETRLEAFVDRLPNGLDTMLGHEGTTPSGGERQRIAIARALLRRPRLLLLDEATSQLDAVTEVTLRDTVVAAARQTTVLVVAHRLSTILSADRIVVLEDGRVRAVGTHDELIVRDPLYAQLAATQLGSAGAAA